jgi:hypothetical protein
MDDNQQFLWLIERNHEDYLTWIAVWLGSLIGVMTILVGVISRQGTLSSNHLVLIWFLYWGLVGGMIFSVYRLVNNARRNLFWSLKLDPKNYKIIRDEAKKVGGLAGSFVHVKDENTNDEKAEIRECVRISTYFINVAIAGVFFELAVGELLWVFVTACIIFLISIFLPYIVGRLKRLIKSRRLNFNPTNLIAVTKLYAEFY